MTSENVCSGSAVVPRGHERQRNRLSWKNTVRFFNSLAGTAGWTRTTDLLIHSQEYLFRYSNSWKVCTDRIGNGRGGRDAFSVIRVSACPSYAAMPSGTRRMSKR